MAAGLCAAIRLLFDGVCLLRCCCQPFIHCSCAALSCFAIGSSWKRNSDVVVSCELRDYTVLDPGVCLGSSSATRSRSIELHDSDTGGSHQKLLSEYLFSSPTEWWGDQEDKRSPRNPDFKHSGKRELLLLNNQFTPTRLDCGFATLNARLQAGLGSLRGSLSIGVNRLERQKQLWEDFFSNPSEWWDYRLDKRKSGHPDFKHKSTKQPLWLNNRYKPPWVDSRIAALDGDAQQQGGSGGRQGLSSVRLDDELQSLCPKGDLDRALDVLLHMDQQGIVVSEDACIDLLKACNKKKALSQTKRLHAHLARHGLESCGFVGEYLVITLMKCGGLEDALHVFHRLPHRTVFSWTAVISGYTECGKGQEALKIYQGMREEGVEPNEYTFVGLFKACGTLAEKEVAVAVEGQSTKVTPLEVGQTFHADAQRKGFDSDVFVGNTLISMYGKSGSIVEAENVFNGLSHRNVVSWNAMLSAYVEQGEGETALQLYRQMQDEGPSPTERTFVMVLQACCMLAEEEQAGVVEGRLTKAMSLKIGQALHADAERSGFDSFVFVASALVSMYGKCGSIVEAGSVFSGLSQHDVVSWTAMLSAYVEQGEGQKALQLYSQMQREPVTLDDTTFVSTLQACSETGSLEISRQIHLAIVSAGRDPSLLVANTLIHAYGSCASTADAHAVFDALLQLDVVSWTALIAGYAQEGNCVASLQIFKEMQLGNIKPDGVTFLSILSACSHAGLVNRAVEYFESMSRDYGISPEIEHYGTIVDVLGRAGDFTRAEGILSRMPMQPDLPVWLSLLGACGKHGNIELGKMAFDRAVHLQPKQAAAYVLMSNIYADAGLFDCAKEVDDSRQRENAWKKPDQSWIEHDQEVHSFVVGDCKHPQLERLYDLLQQMSVELKEKGPILHAECILHGIAKGKDCSLCGHSEKLAIAFGLLNIPVGKPIRVRKNMHICKDCHNASRLISKMKNREIIVIDENRVHYFKSGKCSCGDYF